MDLNFFIFFEPIYSPINGVEACVGPSIVMNEKKMSCKKIPLEANAVAPNLLEIYVVTK